MEDEAMEDEQSNPNIVAYLHEDILLSIFKYLDMQNKGRAAQVCKSWNEIINQKVLWKNTEVRLHIRNCNRLTCHSIVTRGVKRFKIPSLEVNVCELLNELPHIESIKLSNHCISEYLPLFFQSVSTLTALTFSLPNYFNSHDLNLNLMVQYLQSLEELNFLGYWEVTNSSLRILSNMKKLRILNFSENWLCPLRKISDVGISYLVGKNPKNEAGGIASLEHLYLHRMTHITNNSLKSISQNLVNLVTLDLRECNMLSDAGLKHLIRLKKLKVLNLTEYNITDDGLKYVGQLEGLTSLDLTSCFRITDDGMKYVSQLGRLTSLNLRGCFCITDYGFGLLFQLTNLKHLNVSRYSRVSSACWERVMGQIIRMNCRRGNADL